MSINKPIWLLTIMKSEGKRINSQLAKLNIACYLKTSFVIIPQEKSRQFISFAFSKCQGYELVFLVNSHPVSQVIAD